MSINGDAIVIVKGDELAEAQVASVGAGFMRDALLHEAIAKDAVTALVNEQHPCRVETAAKGASAVARPPTAFEMPMPRWPEVSMIQAVSKFSRKPEFV